MQLYSSLCHFPVLSFLVSVLLFLCSAFIHSSSFLLDILSAAGPVLEAKCTVYRDEQRRYCLPGAHCSLSGELGKQLNVQGGNHSNSGRRLVETQRKVGVSLSRSQESHQW